MIAVIGSWLAHYYYYGKAVEDWYKAANKAIRIEILLRCGDVKGVNPALLPIVICNILMLGHVRVEESKEFYSKNVDLVDRQAQNILSDPDLRRLIILTLQMQLGLCHAHNNWARLNEVVESPVFKAYSGQYPIPTAEEYVGVVKTFLGQQQVRLGSSPQERGPL